MIHVVMDQLPLRLRDGFLNGVKLLGKIKACSAFLEHRYDSPNMPFGPLEPLDDIRVALMNVLFCHRLILSYGRGLAKPEGTGENKTYPIPQDTIKLGSSQRNKWLAQNDIS
jgi:hypothetical protein